MNDDPLKTKSSSVNMLDYGVAQAEVLEVLLHSPDGLTTAELRRYVTNINLSGFLHSMKKRKVIVGRPTGKGNLERFFHPMVAPEAGDPLRWLGIQAIKRMPIQNLETRKEVWLRSRATFLPVSFYADYVNLAPGELGVYNGVRWTE